MKNYNVNKAAKLHGAYKRWKIISHTQHKLEVN